MKTFLFKHISIQTRNSFSPSNGSLEEFLDLLFHPSCLPMRSDIRAHRWEQFGKGDAQETLLSAIREKIKTTIKESNDRGFQENWAYSFNRCLHELQLYESRAGHEPSIIPTVLQYMEKEIGNKLFHLFSVFGDSSDALRECQKLQITLAASNSVMLAPLYGDSDSSEEEGQLLKQNRFPQRH